MKLLPIVVLMLVASVVNAATLDAEKDSPAKQLYTKKCATCHNVDGKGKAAMAKMFKINLESLDLTSEAVAKKTDAELIETITKGKNKMPAFKDKLKDVEIAEAVAYIRSFAVVPATKPAEGAK